ncbi:DUF1826 domain-containing protein [Qipengyuania sp. JC766]|uniref:DUF1826 domain-containing protein n=1 Tax=Qipengyuania sp. JC766 TaxID=3232139 RepID=UPI003457A35B
MPALLEQIAALSSDPDVLHDIRQPDCNLAVWTREPLAGIGDLLGGSQTNIRLTTRADEVPDQIRTELDRAAYPSGAVRDALIADIAGLGRRYAAILDLAEIELRLEIVTTDSCRKWHADYVSARLITTYCGQGTQWLDARDAARVRDGCDPVRPRALATGDVGLFKGRLATEHPAIHRSPPIAGTGEKRLLLVLNPAGEG